MATKTTMDFSFLGHYRFDRYYCHSFHENYHVHEAAAQHGKQDMNYAELTKERCSPSGKYAYMPFPLP
jgi:hypothetical protein